MTKIFRCFGIVAFIICIIAIPSCSKKCNCKNDWQDYPVLYHEGDKVWYHDTCWIAIAQGWGIEPGPWQQNGNDIWKPCEDK